MAIGTIWAVLQHPSWPSAMLEVAGSLLSYLLILTKFELGKNADTKKYPKVIHDV